MDADVYAHTVSRFAEAGILLPTFAQLRNPELIPERVIDALADVDPNEPHPLNLFRVHWRNDPVEVGGVVAPAHLVLPSDITGVDATIVMALGDRFPLIGSHKVLAAYSCLAPRVITGQFDPTTQRAIWPSTGNYCRGGVAISRLMGCRGVAILPEGMSRERFEWLASWVEKPEDVIPTPGCESNVKEIYDECKRLSTDEDNIVFNQFSEFGNYLAHFFVTGRALEDVLGVVTVDRPSARLRAFVSATGSAGTLGAGDYLKESHGAQIVAVEALECPTMLWNGYGEHNIQGIGDKHIPLIHNVMNSDFVIAVSDRSTDCLNVLFNTPVGREYLRTRRGVSEELLLSLRGLGLSSICNLLAAIKYAKYQSLAADDVVLTVATDSAKMYESEALSTLTKVYGGEYDSVSAGEAFGQHVLGASTDHVMELTRFDRKRIFNLGYYTWVEQQGVPIAEFTAREDQAFWIQLRDLIPTWDSMIDDFNAETGVLRGVGGTRGRKRH